MKIKNIYDSWASDVTVTYEELLSHDRNFWQNLILNRNLIVIRGLGKVLTDDELFDVSQQFGTTWTHDVYKQPYICQGIDPSITRTNDKPVSYFRSKNNYFSDRKMQYHADMPHVKEYSYPGRVLYMVQNTTDRSGITSWLNLELGWELCTDEEKKLFDGYEIVLHDMYIPETRMEKFPFLKTNPKTGKPSPLVNCYRPSSELKVYRTWIHHVVKDGVDLSFEESAKFVESVYALLESKTNTLYDHVWETGDMIVYDNWFNVHKRTSVNDMNVAGGRLLKRTTFNF
jgi:alpha-ketoglutarate-dependent taurine dioxygenase